MRGVRHGAMQLGFGLALSCAGVLGCGGMSHGRPPGPDSETHFLTLCDSDCPDDLECLCGVCTTECERDSACARFGAPAACLAPEASAAACGASVPAAVCEATCERDADCAALGPDHACEAGACRAAMASAPPPRVCGVDTMPVETAPRSVEWTPVYDASPVPIVAAHETGVAFIDNDQRVMFLPAGSATPRLAWQHPDPQIQSHAFPSLAIDGDAIYWATAFVETSLPAEPSPPSPPATLERVAIDGTGHAILVSSGVSTFAALSVDERGVYFADAYGQAGLRRVSKDGGDVVDLVPDLTASVTRDGDYFYWTDQSGLFRADPEGNVEPLLARGQEPLVDAGYGLQAHRSGLLFVVEDPATPEGVPKQTIARYDLAEDCLRLYSLPNGGVNDRLLPDGGAVYWKGFEHGGVSPSDPLPEARLWRTDLATGESTELVPDGFAITAIVDLLAQDADAIYAYDSGTDQLVRIAK